MAPRASLDDKLARLRELRKQSLTTEQQAEVRKYLGDRSNLVVAAAAALASENLLGELASDLEAAFERFLVNPVKDDKLCRAKLAVIQTLDKMEHQNSDIFLKGARHVQFEPAWGGPEDTAAPLRAASIVALARVEGIHSLPLVVDAMVDAAKDVRVAAAVALGAVGSEAAGLVLRLKVRLGDPDPDVLSECLGGLLAVDDKANLALVSEFLEPSNAVDCEAAALALGKSRLLEALGPLQDCLQRCHSSELRQQILLAISILRRPAATEFLMEIVATEPEEIAIAALSALRIHKADPRLCEQLAALIEKRNLPMLQSAFVREFPSR